MDEIYVDLPFIESVEEVGKLASNGISDIILYKFLLNEPASKLFDTEDQEYFQTKIARIYIPNELYYECDENLLIFGIPRTNPE